MTTFRYAPCIIKLKPAIIGILLVIGIDVQSQILNTHYQYQLNWLNINPAYTGHDDGLSAILNSGTQWVGVSENPNNTMIGLHGSPNKHMGLGAKMIFDNRGIFSTITAEALYAYKVSLNDHHKINFGVSAGIYSSALDNSDLQNNEFTNAADPSLSSDYYNQSSFLLSFGVLYAYDKLEVGVSLPHMFVSGSPMSEHIFGTAKYDFDLSTDLKLSPMLVYQHLNDSKDMADIGAKLEFRELIWLQLAYRTNNSMSYALGLKLKEINLGYLYNSSFGPVNDISKGNHQVFVSYTFKRKSTKKGKTAPLAPATSDRLNSLLNDIEDISDSPNHSLEQELSAIQKELADILNKLQSNEFTPEDEKRLKVLEDRIDELKKEL